MATTLDKIGRSSASDLAAIVREAPSTHLGQCAIRELEIRAERWAAINAAARTEHSAADLAQQVYSHTTEWHLPVPSIHEEA